MTFPLGVTFFSNFYNPNLHNIARSDSLGFKTKNPNGSSLRCVFPCDSEEDANL